MRITSAACDRSRWVVFPGVRQAQWLTKTKLVEGLPPAVQGILDNPALGLQELEERAKHVVSHARLWDTAEVAPRREQYW